MTIYIARVTIIIIPQIIKSIRTASTNDIAYSWTIIYALGLIMLITYGIYFELWSIYAPACLELVCIIILFFLKYLYANPSGN